MTTISNQQSFLSDAQWKDVVNETYRRIDNHKDDEVDLKQLTPSTIISFTTVMEAKLAIESGGGKALRSLSSKALKALVEAEMTYRGLETLPVSRVKDNIQVVLEQLR